MTEGKTKSEQLVENSITTLALTLFFKVMLKVNHFALMITAFIMAFYFIATGYTGWELYLTLSFILMERLFVQVMFHASKQAMKMIAQTFAKGFGG